LFQQGTYKRTILVKVPDDFLFGFRKFKFGAIENFKFQRFEKRTNESLVVFLFDFRWNLFLDEVKHVLELFLVSHKSVSRKFIIIFCAEKFLEC